MCGVKEESWSDHLPDKNADFEFTRRDKNLSDDWVDGYYQVASHSVDAPVDIQIVSSLARAKALRKGDVPAAYDISLLWTKALFIPMAMYAISLIVLAAGLCGLHTPDPNGRIAIGLKLAGTAILLFLVLYLFALVS